MNYIQFLQKPDEVLRLPYFAGKSVCDDKLTYRLREALQPGWYQFRKAGRYLTVANSISPELDACKLPRAIGYVFRGRLISNDSQDRLFGLPADEDLPKFCPVAARKWRAASVWRSLILERNSSTGAGMVSVRRSSVIELRAADSSA